MSQWTAIMQARVFAATLLTVLPFAALAQAPAYQPQIGKSGIDLGAMDTNVSPCTNFYQYACGNWRAKNPIPPDQSRWARFNELRERNLRIEREILEKAAQPSPNRSAIDQKIGDYYARLHGRKRHRPKRSRAPQAHPGDSINALNSKSSLPPSWPS